MKRTVQSCETHPQFTRYVVMEKRTCAFSQNWQQQKMILDKRTVTQHSSRARRLVQTVGEKNNLQISMTM